MLSQLWIELLKNLARNPHCEKETFPVGIEFVKRGVVHFRMPSLKRNTLLESIARGVFDHSVTCTKLVLVK